MPFPRMTTHRWMIAVAVAGVLLGGDQSRRRWASLSAEYEARSSEYALEAEVCRFFAERWAKATPPVSAARRTRLARLAESCDRLAAKYRFAARRPWLPVAPDPSEPK